MTESIEPQLLADLKRLRSNAYAPYSDHPVAVMIETDSGQRFGGNNVEVAHFKSVCAEASAISAMIAAGERSIRSVWVLGPNDLPCTPCGDCRQRLREFGAETTEIRAVDDNGRVTRTHTLDRLLPDAFGPENIPG
ncbi:cytidine deaminase [Wenzhouxiangella sp. EGI_FJ10305]|uniref:cytidine deaminase n=1 Tax=Wenzhouxiangella sp. EGI_FJ10305 TaxID=3243768 RepID=UPI0035D6E6C8